MFLATLAVGQDKHQIPDGTPVQLRSTEAVSSASAKTGDIIDFKVLENVVLNGEIRIAQGSSAQGTVTLAEPKKWAGRAGRLEIAINYVSMPNGDKLPLRATKEISGGGHGGAVTGAVIGSALVFWPAAPFFLMIKGKDITIPKGTEVMAYIVNPDTPIAVGANTHPALVLSKGCEIGRTIFNQAPSPKAFAISDNGQCGYAYGDRFTEDKVKYIALENCKSKSKGASCRLID
jgi:hypothetical protein